MRKATSLRVGREYTSPIAGSNVECCIASIVHVVHGRYSPRNLLKQPPATVFFMSNADQRYSRQRRFAPIGDDGQQRIQASTALICGCGALGTVLAERLARAGVGRLKIVDRDWVELSNLQRQALFHEQHAASATPKAVAAAEVLGQINSSVQIDSFVEDLSYENIRDIAADCDIVCDGTDNFETRFLVNDYCVSKEIPWVHGGCLGAGGQVLSILPGETACFRCLVPDLPPREAMETCDSAGVLGSAIGLIASMQAGEVLKILSGNRDSVCRGLVVVDGWNNDYRVVGLPRGKSCVCCQQHNYPFLNGEIRSAVTVLCGKNAVQIESPHQSVDSLNGIAKKIEGLGKVTQNAYFVRLALESHTLTIFRGGRTVVEGTTSESDAKSLVSQILGA